MLQQFTTTDVLRLEVEEDPTGLVNLVQNPQGDLGGWGWVTPVATSRIGNQFGSLTYFAPNPSAPSHFYTEDLPVAAGRYVSAFYRNAGGLAGGHYWRTRFEWINAAGAVISSTAQSAYLNSIGNVGTIYGPHQAPVGTVAVRFRFDTYNNNAGANPSAGKYLNFDDVTVASAATAAELAGLGYLEPVQFLDVLGPTHDIKVTRDELAVGLLNATILDAALDPAKADLLRPGRRVRLMTLDPVGDVWTPLFVGKASNAKVTYDYKDPKKPAAKRARITLSASDNIAQVASTRRSEGVATIAALPYVLEGAGVPWNVNGSGNQVGAATVVARNPNASALDQVAITRDSVRGYAWVDRRGIVQVWDAASISTTIARVLDESTYTDLAIDYDTERCVNTVNLKYLRINLATGETVEVSYGPYVDQPSIDQWGPREATFTVQGIAETAPNMAAYAAAVLAANATPVIRANSVTVAVRTEDEIANALLDLYDLVTVSNTEAELDQDLRIVGVEHTITATQDGGKWVTSYSFAAQGGVAPPQNTPAPGPTSTVRDGEWQAWVPTSSGWTPGASTISARWMRIGTTAFYRIKVTLGAGFVLNTGAAFGLPVTLRNESLFAGADLRMEDVGSSDYQLIAHQNPSTVSVWARAANGGYATVWPFVHAVGDFFYIEGYGEIQ